MHSSTRGFTLIELSIVLVIIGLISGSLLVGMDMTRAALIRSQVKQFEQYTVAYHAFRTKYACLPGDCLRASQFFNGALNGDGDEEIENNMSDYYDSSGMVQWSLSTEYREFFISLGAAGMVSGTFDGSATIGQGMAALTYNDSKGFFVSDSKSFRVLNPGVSRNPDIAGRRTGRNWIWAVACNVSGDSLWMWDDDCSIFRGDDLKNLDIKMDEGQPLRGRVFGFGAANSMNNCLDISGTDYDALNPEPQCVAAVRLD